MNDKSINDDSRRGPAPVEGRDARALLRQEAGWLGSCHSQSGHCHLCPPAAARQANTYSSRTGTIWVEQMSVQNGCEFRLGKAGPVDFKDVPGWKVERSLLVKLAADGEHDPKLVSRYRTGKRKAGSALPWSLEGNSTYRSSVCKDSHLRCIPHSDRLDQVDIIPIVDTRPKKHRQCSQLPK